MKLSTAQLKAIVDTLPIGFYCGRQIPIHLAEENIASSYSPIHDVITISTFQLSVGVEACETMEEATSIIRSNFYHELSHAILTPKDMTPTTAVNIVEDERIERICKDSYYGVNFEEAKLKLNGGKEWLKQPPANPEEAFFRLARFGIGDKEFVDRYEKLLKKYENLDRNSSEIAWSSYKEEIQELYHDFTGEYDQEKENEAYGEGNPEDGDKEGEGKKKGRYGYDPGKGDKKLRGGISIKRIAEKLLVRNINFNFHKQVEQLFENYRRKNNKGGSLKGYSGVLNPRLAGREDYKYFERPSPIRGGNPYGTLHLNLFIDTSGSFWHNDKATNAILHTLSLIERKNPNFSFDVVTMGQDEIILDKKDRYIESGGGNHLSKKIHRIYRKLQLPQTGNYNIILFDGDAYSNDCHHTSDWYGDYERGKGFSAFANNSCTIITDEDNRKYIEKYCANTHTIYTRNYVEELYNNVLKALQKALI